MFFVMQRGRSKVCSSSLCAKIMFSVKPVVTNESIATESHWAHIFYPSASHNCFFHFLVIFAKTSIIISVNALS